MSIMSSVAIVAAAVEGTDITTYFGSLLSFDHHKRSAIELGLIDKDEQPTDLAFLLYMTLSLNECSGRYAGWHIKINNQRLTDADIREILQELGGQYA